MVFHLQGIRVFEGTLDFVAVAGAGGKFLNGSTQSLGFKANRKESA